ncbi:hypothetical protein C8J56DRAFT_990582 [Mycena floridula]|nr:hypothetical protein C8J56DRAFT_990582 [Mycena floridula]
MFDAQIPLILAFVVLFSNAGDSTVLGFNHRRCLTVQLFRPALFAINYARLWFGPSLAVFPPSLVVLLSLCGLTNRDFPRQIVKT